MMRLDCGDNSCIFATRPLTGMRTNGGCRCLKDLDTKRRLFITETWQKLSRLTAALNDNERVERVVKQEGYGKLAHELYIIGRHNGIDDYRAEILKEVL